jgi:hypothetical protein
MTEVHSINLSRLWTTEGSTHTRNFGAPRLSADESAWLVGSGWDHEARIEFGGELLATGSTWDVNITTMLKPRNRLDVTGGTMGELSLVIRKTSA